MKTTKELKRDAKAVIFREGVPKAWLLFMIPWIWLIIDGANWVSNVHDTVVQFSKPLLSDTALTQAGPTWTQNLVSMIALVLTIFVALVTTSLIFTLCQLYRDRERLIKPSDDMFQAFASDRLWKAFGLYLVKNIFIGLWSMLLVVPGIIKTYSYSQAEMILYDELENGEYGGLTSAISKSRQMMNGHKGRRFWLDITFIGWFALTALTLGILGLYTLPYYTATAVGFYENLRQGYVAGDESERQVDADLQNHQW